MNRFDERRSRFWRHERGRDEAHRDESHRDDDYRLRPDEESGRSAGDSGRQPFSRDPYGYYPGQGRPGRERESALGSGRESGRDWGGDWRSSQGYGQREPYNTRGGSQRSRWGGPGNEEGSRYSESQYGMGRRRSRFDPYAGGSEPEFGEGPFADTSEAPRYFGSGNYADGGSSYTGGYDQRERTRYPGSLGEDPFRSSNRPRYRTGPKGYTRSDDRIREDISERLMLADGIDSSEVTVSVKDGRVSLEGTVPTRGMKHAIEDLADYTAGVTDVDNRIRVEREGQSAASTGVQSASGISPKMKQ